MQVRDSATSGRGKVADYLPLCDPLARLNRNRAWCEVGVIVSIAIIAAEVETKFVICAGRTKSSRTPTPAAYGSTDKCNDGRTRRGSPVCTVFTLPAAKRTAATAGAAVVVCADIRPPYIT